ncbi:MAG: hypothetical protein ABL879_01795 [Devosia sp.]
MGIPVGLALVVYVVLLFHPIPLPFLGKTLRGFIVASMPAGSDIELGEMALAVEGYVWPVVQFSPVTYRDTITGAKVEMDALEVGFSPVRALIGQPGASITMVGPHIQVNQDLFGPRLSNFEIVRDPEGGADMVRVLEGTSSFPRLGFGESGIEISGAEITDGTRVRSDNDWLIFNLEAMEKGIATIIEQAELGRFSRFIIKGGTLQINDALYSTLRTFNDINFDITPSPGGKVAEGLFAADYGGTTMKGILERIIDDKGDTRLKASVTNFNLPAFLPSAGPDAATLMEGTPAISIDVGFAAGTGKILDGQFHVDLTGMDIVIGPDRFPIATSIIEVSWQPTEGLFTMQEAAMTIGRTSGKMSGVFRLGIDDLYGPIVGISMVGKDVVIRPNDLAEPDGGFDTVSFRGWSAPLYGAFGIDQSVLQKGNARIESRGRIDMLRKGMGFDMSIAGQGLKADDLKRMWPYFAGGDARNWFVKNITGGVVESANMKFSFPVGSIATDGSTSDMPQNGVFIEMIADDVKIKPVDQLPEIVVHGKTRLQMHDSEFSVSGENGTVDTDKGTINITNAGMTWVPGSDGSSFQFSGAMSGPIPAVAEAVDKIAPGALASQQVPFDMTSLAGTLNVGITSTTALDAKGATTSSTYSVTGKVAGLGTTQPIQGQTFANGELAFLATQEGFRVGGTADISGLETALVVDGTLGATTPDVTINATIDTAGLSKLGFDAGAYASGPVTLSAKPQPDGTIDVSLDVTRTALNLKELGISKPAGDKGSLKATVKQTGDLTEVSDIGVAFGNVNIQGGLEFDAKKGLQSAQFSRFALSPGDAAQISLTPIKDGFSVRVRGDQFDLRPVLGRTFNLSGATGGATAAPGTSLGGQTSAPTAATPTIAVDAEIKRAIGFYKTTAFNVDAEMALKGSDMRKVSLQAQLGNGRSISITTNPTDSGRSMSVVFNDMGSLLRLLGVYAQVEGGEGSLVLNTNTSDKTDTGQFTIKNFAIVDEEKVADILASHSESRKLIANQNKLSFGSAELKFVRRSDRIQVTEGLLSGDTVGGTINGFIYPDRNQLDLAGTYVPMFGVNNAFAKLFGPLGGSRNEGLFGVSFAVTGPITSPVFKVNPLSALMPGAFRSLFDYRARERK